VLDLSSFSKFEVSGPDAESYLNRMITGIAPKREGKSALAYSTTADGFIESEWTITHFDENLFYLLGPAMSQTRDFDKLCFWRRSGEDVDVRNVSQEFGCLALTGPRSRDILLELTDAALENVAFPWLDARQVSVAGVPTRALRLSYVGELGWELHMPMADLDTAYAAILEAGAKHGLANFGLYAVNSLRMEKGYGAWGHEYTMDVRMKEAGLSRFVHFRKNEFLGREALLACEDAMPSRQIAYLEVDASDADCLGSEPVFADGKVVGLTTSGAYGHTTGKSLAFAYVDSDRMGAEDLEVGLLGQTRRVQGLSKPVHDPENSLLKR
jgi:dimethylglycine dehydrogenase